MIKSKVKPTNYKLITAKPTLKHKDYRWCRNVRVQYVDTYYGDKRVVVVLDIGDDNDRSLASMGCFRDVFNRPCMKRIDDTRVYSFTNSNYQAIDELGNDVELKADDIVTIRFTPVVKDNRALFVLEGVIKHSNEIN